MPEKFQHIKIEEALPSKYRDLLNQTDEGSKAAQAIDMLVDRHNKLTDALNESLDIAILATKHLASKDMQEALELKRKTENSLLFGWLGI